MMEKDCITIFIFCLNHFYIREIKRNYYSFRKLCVDLYCLRSARIYRTRNGRQFVLLLPLRFYSHLGINELNEDNENRELYVRLASFTSSVTVPEL